MDLFVVSNIHLRISSCPDLIVVDLHGVEGDVDVAEADVDADAAHDLVGGEGAVRARDLRLAHVPRGAAVANCRNT